MSRPVHLIFFRAGVRERHGLSIPSGSSYLNKRIMGHNTFWLVTYNLGNWRSGVSSIERACLLGFWAQRCAKAPKPELSDQPLPGRTAKAMESLELLLQKCLPHRLGPSKVLRTLA